MSIPSLPEWKEDNPGKGRREYYNEFPELKKHLLIFIIILIVGVLGLFYTIYSFT